MKKMSIAVMAVLAVSTLDLGAAPARDVRVFVDGAECRGLKALGKAVARPVGEATLFTAGGSFANRWLTDASVGPGNFLVKARLSIDNPIFCDASIRVGGGEREVIVTLQGINGLFSISGPLVRTDLETGRVMKSSRMGLPSVTTRCSSGTIRALSAAKKASSCSMEPPFSMSSRQVS